MRYHLFTTREAWLLKAIKILEKEKFKPLGHPLVKTRVSVGFPDGSKRAIGQYWYPESTKDGHGNIFIHPGQGEPVDILAILVHELVHNSCGVRGHGKQFKKLALAVGLEGKMRSTNAGPELVIYLKKLASRLGKFPHSAIKKGAEGPTPKQTTRMIRMECGKCGFICRASLSKILEIGAPFCACTVTQMQVDLPEEDDE
jgi:hypothetical protein